MSDERQRRTIEVYDLCTCGAVLHSMAEGERGTCSSCWFKAMRPEKKAALGNLVASAFDGSSKERQGELIDKAFGEMKKDGEV